MPSAPARDAETPDQTSRRPPMDSPALSPARSRCQIADACRPLCQIAVPTMMVRLAAYRPLCFLGWAVYIIHVYTWVWALSAMGPGPAHMLPYPQGRHWLAGGGGLVGAKETREMQRDKRRVHQVPSSEFETACSTQQTVLNKDNARAQGRYEPLSASSFCSFIFFSAMECR